MNIYTTPNVKTIELFDEGDTKITIQSTVFKMISISIKSNSEKVLYYLNNELEKLVDLVLENDMNNKKLIYCVNIDKFDDFYETMIKTVNKMLS